MRVSEHETHPLTFLGTLRGNVGQLPLSEKTSVVSDLEHISQQVTQVYQPIGSDDPDPGGTYGPPQGPMMTLGSLNVPHGTPGLHQGLLTTQGPVQVVLDTSRPFQVPQTTLSPTTLVPHGTSRPMELFQGTTEPITIPFGTLEPGHLSADYSGDARGVSPALSPPNQVSPSFSSPGQVTSEVNQVVIYERQSALPRQGLKSRLLRIKSNSGLVRPTLPPDPLPPRAVNP